MRRFSSAAFAIALMLLCPFLDVADARQQPAQPPATQPPATQPPAQQTAPKMTFEGDTALWTVAIKPDKTADFEKIVARLHEGLAKSDKPERKQQVSGWKVMRLAKPLPDGNIAYVHIINPVVPGADYTVMQALYELYPEERQALYDLYRGAFAANLSLAVGNMVAAAPAAPGR
jgi:hypothetical protein